MTGHFIAFEGGEGSGKSTQARRLAERLGSQALLTFEPGDSPLGAEVRRLVLDSPDLDITDRAEALLMAADRAQHVAEVDRARARRRPHRDLRPLRRLVDRLPGPRPPAAGRRGRAAVPLGRPRAGGPTWSCCSRCSPEAAELATAPRQGPLESAGDDFHRRVHDGFLLQAMEDPDRWAIIDGTGTEDEVAAAIWTVVDASGSRDLT